MVVLLRYDMPLQMTPILLNAMAIVCRGFYYGCISKAVWIHKDINELGCLFPSILIHFTNQNCGQQRCIDMNLKSMKPNFRVNLFQVPLE